MYRNCYTFCNTTYHSKILSPKPASRFFSISPAELLLSRRAVPGHFGRIPLPYAIYNTLFVGLLATVLQCVCLHCHMCLYHLIYGTARRTIGRARITHKLAVLP